MVVNLVNTTNNSIKCKLKKFYRYNFFVHYLKRLGYFLYKYMKLKSFCIFSLNKKKLKKRIKLGRYKKRKKHKKFAVLRKNIKKWWFYFKRKKRRGGRLIRLNFWLNSNKCGFCKKSVKPNSFIILAEKQFSTVYSYLDFSTIYNFLFEDYKSLFFVLTVEDEFFDLDHWNYIFDYNEIFDAATQFFFNFFFRFNKYIETQNINIFNNHVISSYNDFQFKVLNINKLINHNSIKIGTKVENGLKFVLN